MHYHAQIPNFAIDRSTAADVVKHREEVVESPQETNTPTSS